MSTATAIAKGSIGQIAQRDGTSIAESFISADVLILMDTSGSMGASDSIGGKQRYDVASQELRQLQANLPGKIAVLSFSDNVFFCPGGIPTYQGGSTDLAGALRFARVADVPGIRFIVISDGEPNEPQKALNEAKKYKAKIDTIFCGPEDRPLGRDFLARLAAASGGQIVTADRVRALGTEVQKLLAS